MDHEGGEGLGKSRVRLKESELEVHYSSVHQSFKLSNDPSLSSLPILAMFLKSYSLPYLGLQPPSASKHQVSTKADETTLSEEAQSEAVVGNAQRPQVQDLEADDFVEKEIRDRFKRMCEGYFETISKKLVKEHLVRVH